LRGLSAEGYVRFSEHRFKKNKNENSKDVKIKTKNESCDAAKLVNDLKKLVVLPAGSSMDIVGRMVGQWLSERLERPFIVENRPGAGSNLAIETVAKAAPDGYTLGIVATINAINTTLYSNLGFDFTKDIAPVASLVSTPQVMEVHPSVPAKTVPEFVDYAKANAGKINMATGSIGTMTHVAGELFEMKAGVKLLHVPYHGSPPALTDLLRGQTQVMFDTLPTSIAFIKAGQLRPLAVTTKESLDALPGVPPMNKFVHDYETSFWLGIGAPRGTPPDIVMTLNREIDAALNDHKVAARVATLGDTPIPMTPDEFGALITKDVRKWGEVVKFAGIKAE
jgi:tripartite-type tricarboxylate transporter receptor subunit TctC